MPSLRRLGGAGQQPHVKSYFGAHARYGFVVRKPVSTVLRYDEQRDRVDKAIESQLKAGRQVYIVYPLIEENMLCHKHAIALVGASAHTAAKLVELRQSESFGILDYHGGGVGNVHTYFYHCGRHEYRGLA